MEQKISYILAGSELVETYENEELIDVAHYINENGGHLFEYDHSKPIHKLLNDLSGWRDFVAITEEEANTIKSHLE
jgi:hypothetical protein